MVASRDARRRAKEMIATPAIQTIEKPIGGEKNGGKRTVILNKGTKWYPADDIRKPVPSRKHVHKPTKLRASITPGTVLILLAGTYRGSRVIFLKQLASGLLLVTGPYSVNRVPLRRVDQTYVIATKTKVDVSGVDVNKFDDAYFKRSKPKKESVVMETDAGEKPTSPKSQEKIADQKTVDAVLVPVVEAVPQMKSYLKSKFTLTKGQYPHEMIF
eukprot:GFKZ01015650.1.p1 GENE.GFKZ01015650.1~~GFKZ01015650.1.p1  ORF type:complete len:215 (+),score=31.13 GFKZ01015650.1:172-816(+)